MNNKDDFINLVLPEIIKTHNKLEEQYSNIKNKIMNNENENEIVALKKTYKAKTNQELLGALKPHPISITLAQAAMESSWGRSRFFQEANNIFGVWSFNKKEPRIEASQTRGSKKIYLKKYKNIEDSIIDYYKNIGRSFAFKDFRQERLKTHDALILVAKLDRYSEKSHEYTKELASIIRYNKFTKHDIFNKSQDHNQMISDD